MSIEQFSAYVESGNDLPTDLTEIRDVNGVFHPYLGTWQAQYNGNTIKLIVTESTYTYDDGLIVEELVTRFEIKDSNGNVLESTMSLPCDSPNLITFEFIGTRNAIHNYYFESVNCGNANQILYSLNWSPGSLNPSSMTFHVLHNEFFDDYVICPNGNSPSTFPLNQDIIFTKI